MGMEDRQMLCYGYSRKPKPMTDACKSCNLRKIIVTTSYSDEEVQFVSIGQLVESCSRDNPNFKPMKKQEFLVEWHKIPIFQRNTGLLDAYLIGKSRGIVE